MAELLKLCPVLHQPYGPPLVSLNGGMHMVLSVGAYIQPFLCRTCFGCSPAARWQAADSQLSILVYPVPHCARAAQGAKSASMTLHAIHEHMHTEAALLQLICSTLWALHRLHSCLYASVATTLAADAVL